jgi:hypothetical protein
VAIDLRSLKRVMLTDPPATPDRGTPDRGTPDPISPSDTVTHGTGDHDGGSCELCEQIQSELAANPVEGAATDAPADPPVIDEAVAATNAIPLDTAPVDTAPVGTAEPVPADSGLGLLDADPIPPPTAAQPKPALVATDPGIGPGGWRRRKVFLIGMLASVLAAVALVLVVLYATSSKSRATAESAAAQSAAQAAAGAQPSAAGAASPPSSSSVAAVLDWARQNLPLSAPLLTDQQTQRALFAAGFTAVQIDNAQATPTFAYLIDTPAWRDGAPVDGPAITGSIPVAVFGSGAAQVTVRQAVADSAAVVSDRQATDASTRRAAEQQLLSNHAIQVKGNALSALQAGQLDLRAATVIAYLANSTTVTLADVTTSGPEQQAGLPVRSIDISIGAPAVMQTIVSGLPVAYQPASVTQLSNGAVRMVWPLSAEPLPGLS